MASEKRLEIDRGVESKDWLKTGDPFFGEPHPVKRVPENIPMANPTVKNLPTRACLLELILFKII
jgi:hypothetical protein